MDEKVLKQQLSQKSPEFKKVLDLHREYEARLQELSDKSYLTDDEDREQKEIKKKKLVLKDRMYFLMAQYQKSLL
ncbi:MAG: hypothetical protein WBB73_02040 [Candidatus Aminicenantaceae bacterium]